MTADTGLTRRYDSQDMALRGRIGAFSLHSRHDAREITQSARETFLSRFEREVDPDERLDPAERQRRAHYARKAHFARLALKSARARAAKRAQEVDDASAA